MIEAIHELMPDKDTYKIVKGLYKYLVPKNLHRIRRKIDSTVSTIEEVR